MNSAVRSAFATICLAAAGMITASFAQTPPVAVLQVDVENFRHYQYDVSDYTKFASDPSKTNAVNAKNFPERISFADIVSVNGKPAKGTQVLRVTGVGLTPAAGPGQALADIIRNGFYISIYEILQADGTPVGSITVSGFAGGAPPPGAPLAAKGNNAAITGGTGAFFGIRGEQTISDLPAPEQVASVTEDPFDRRANASTNHHVIFRVIPMESPAIVSTASGPAVVHASDFSPVTTAKPAKSGEILALIASGLGPTRPGVDPGQPFPSSPLQLVNSPVEATVNGVPAQVLYAGGYPGTTDAYQVNVQLPSGISPGMASLQLSSAWIPGVPVSIPIQ
jgi:uncharacterized protein (TIGR03437 family)